MEGEPWNRVNILFPSAASTVHIKFTSSTGSDVKNQHVSHFSLKSRAHFCGRNAQKCRCSRHVGAQREFAALVTNGGCFAAAVLKPLLLENEKVLKLIRSSILQTEIRVLYALLHNLTNHFRGSKTIKALQQVSTDAQSLPCRRGNVFNVTSKYQTCQI